MSHVFCRLYEARIRVYTPRDDGTAEESLVRPTIAFLSFMLAVLALGCANLLAPLALISMVGVEGPVITSLNLEEPDAVTYTRQADGGFVVGSPGAPVTVVLFEDFACPHCQAYKETVDRVFNMLVRTGETRLESRIFPTAGGEMTVTAGRVAECADMWVPGGYWIAREYLYGYALAGEYNDLAARIAEDMALDPDTLLDCMANARQVEADVALGRALGTGGTPAVMIRYGESEPEYFTLDGTTYDRGGAPYEVIEAIVQRSQ